MVEVNLRPTDPVRWFLAYTTERAIAEEQSDDSETVVPNAR